MRMRIRARVNKNTNSEARRHARMTRYVKRSIAIASVAVAFLLGFPATELALTLLRRVWDLYGSYIRMWLALWLEQHGALFIVLCLLCAAVATVYGVVLLPLVLGKKEFQIYRRLFVDDSEFISIQPVVPTRLQRNLKDFFQLIEATVNFEHLFPQLYQDNVLKYEDGITRIRSEPSRGCQVMCLIDTIDRMGRDGVKRFIESVAREHDHIGHQSLAEELKKGFSELFPTSNDGNSSCSGGECISSERSEASDPPISAMTTPTQHTPDNKPKLQLETVMDMLYSFSDEDAKQLEEWGLQIFPSQAIRGTLFVSACLVGNFELPPDYELVSPVFYFWSEEKLADLLKFDVQHSVDAQTKKQATCLSFITADPSTGPPFQFSLAEGGLFRPGCTRGVISAKPQGLLAIVKRNLGRLTLRTEPLVQYDAQVFYTWDTQMEYECTAHFVVTPSTKAWQKTVERHFKDAIQGDKVAVTFAKSCLTVGIPDDGVLARGWKITCTTSKTIANCNTIGKFVDRLAIPECKFTMTWLGGDNLQPSELHLKVPFTGSHQKKAESFFHLQSRCSQGDEMKGKFACDMDERRHRLRDAWQRIIQLPNV